MLNGTLVDAHVVAVAPATGSVVGAVDALPASPALQVGRFYTLGGALEDAGMALLLAYAVPVAILLVGSPIALLARLISEIVTRLVA